MAEEPKQSKGIGELFVEFGAKGLGTLMKGLRTVSADFLLTKNAAEQAIKPIMSMGQKATGAVTHWSKLSATMGMSIKELQDIQIFSKLNNVDFDSYINQIKTVQQKLIDIRTGQSNDVQGLTILGLTPYDFDPRKPLEFLDKVKQRVLQVDEVTGAAALRWLGLDENLLYLWGQGNDKFNERLKLTDRELKNLEEQQKGWNILSASWESAQTKFMANQTWINKLLEKTSDWLLAEHPLIENIIDVCKGLAPAIEPWVNKIMEGYQGLFQFLKLKQEADKEEKRLNEIEVIKNPTNLTIEQRERYKKAVKQQHEAVQKERAKYIENENNKKNQQALNEWKQGFNWVKNAGTNIKNRMQQENYDPITGKYLGPIDQQYNLNPLPNVPAPATASNNIGNYNVEIKQYITGENPQQIASASGNKVQDVLNSLEYQNQWSR